METTKRIYISGPRMGTNNYMNGIELKDIKKSTKKSKSKKTKRKK